MAGIQDLPLGRAMLAVKDTGMKPNEVSAVANVVSGLAALANTNAPVPLSLIQEWKGQLNHVETSRRLPKGHAGTI